MIKLIILILLIVLFSSVYIKKEKFSFNPNNFIPKYLEIQKHFRQDCKSGVFSCVKSNPYKSVLAYKPQFKDKKYISFKNTQLSSHLLPIKVNK